MNISVFYGVPNEAYQIPNIFSINLDSFVKGRLVKTGVHGVYKLPKLPDSGFCRNDRKGNFQIYYDFINPFPFPEGSLHMIGAG